MKKYIIWAADGVVFSEKKEHHLLGGDIKSTVHHQLLETFQSVADQNPALTMPTSENIDSALNHGMNERAIFEQYAPHDLCEALSNTYEAKEKDRRLANVQVLPGIEEAITTLSKKGYKNLIIGFRAIDFIQAVLEKNGLSDYVAVIPTDTTKLRLPNPDIWTQLITPSFSDITTENTVVIGKESVELVWAARISKGIDSIWLRSSGGDFSRCMDLGQKRTIYNTKDCFNIIANFCQDALEKASSPSMSLSS